jgi:hypothetical protein
MTKEQEQEILKQAMDLIDELELHIHYMFMAIKDLDT